MLAGGVCIFSVLFLRAAEDGCLFWYLVTRKGVTGVLGCALATFDGFILPGGF